MILLGWQVEIYTLLKILLYRHLEGSRTFCGKKYYIRENERVQATFISLRISSPTFWSCSICIFATVTIPWKMFPETTIAVIRSHLYELGKTKISRGSIFAWTFRRKNEFFIKLLTGVEKCVSFWKRISTVKCNSPQRKFMISIGWEISDVWLPDCKTQVIPSCPVKGD